MAHELIDSELLALLRSVDTPTVCNAIEEHKVSVVFHNLQEALWCVQTLRAVLWLVLLKQQKLQP